MNTLWGRDQEKDFFIQALEMAAPEQLFYVTENKRYLAYWPQGYPGHKTTLQSRNSFIGSYTEKWAASLFAGIAEALGAYAVHRVVAKEIGLTNQSPADVAICKSKDLIQKPENILMIIEVKMSIVWNWEFSPETMKLVCVGDYKTHQGNPGLLRSDTMLKAIGKSINIRVSGFAGTRIPIVVVGNTPITKNYHEKVDHLRNAGIIQGFWSINPRPLDDDGENIKSTSLKGFYRFDHYEELKQHTVALLTGEREFFSGMKTRTGLGQIIEIANKEASYEGKAKKFLELLHQLED